MKENEKLPGGNPGASKVRNSFFPFENPPVKGWSDKTSVCFSETITEGATPIQEQKSPGLQRFEQNFLRGFFSSY